MCEPDHSFIPSPTPTDVTNTEALGRILYTDFIYYFQAAGLVLLVAMVGAIVLTLRHKEGVKRQSVAAQVARNPATAMSVIKVASGESVIPEARGRIVPEARASNVPEMVAPQQKVSAE